MAKNRKTNRLRIKMSTRISCIQLSGVVESKHADRARMKQTDRPPNTSKRLARYSKPPKLESSNPSTTIARSLSPTTVGRVSFVPLTCEVMSHRWANIESDHLPGRLVAWGLCFFLPRERGGCFFHQ